MIDICVNNTAIQFLFLTLSLTFLYFNFNYSLVARELLLLQKYLIILL